MSLKHEPSSEQGLIVSWKGAPFAKEVLPSNRIYLPSLLAPAETVVVRSGALCASTSKP